MKCQGWCPWCYEGLKGRDSHAGHSGYRVVRPVELGGLEMALQRRDGALRDRGALAKAVPCAWACGYRVLWEFLSEAKYEDGTARVLPSVTLFVDETGLKACLNDRDQGQVAFVSAGTLEGLWEALERGLTNCSLDWRSATAKRRK